MVSSSSSLTHHASDKPYGITNIKAYILFTLDIEHMNYDAWWDVFETHCIAFGVAEHLSPQDDKVIVADKKEWDRVDALVKMFKM